MLETLKRLGGYVGGGVLLAIGALSLVSAPPVGIVLVFFGLFVFPPARRRLSIEISILRLVAWLVSVLLVLFGALVATDQPLAAALAIGAGLLALPPVSGHLTDHGSGQPRRAAVALVVLVAAAASIGLVYAELDEPDVRNNATHSMGEPFPVNASDGGQLRINVADARTLDGGVPVGRETPVTPVSDTYLVVS